MTCMRERERKREREKERGWGREISNPCMRLKMNNSSCLMAIVNE